MQSKQNEQLYDLLMSEAEMDQQMNPANVVDGLFAIARGLQAVARAIRETNNNAK